MALNVGELVTGLSFKADDTEAKKYDRRVDEMRAKARHKIETPLGAKVDHSGFVGYNRELDRTEQRVKRSGTIKAKLGVDTFDTGPLKAYREALGHVDKATSGLHGTNSLVAASFDDVRGKFKELFGDSARI